MSAENCGSPISDILSKAYLSSGYAFGIRGGRTKPPSAINRLCLSAAGQMRPH